MPKTEVFLNETPDNFWSSPVKAKTPPRPAGSVVRARRLTERPIKRVAAGVAEALFVSQLPRGLFARLALSRLRGESGRCPHRMGEGAPTVVCLL